MARETDEPLDYDPEDPQDVADVESSIRSEKGVSKKQKEMQARAYLIARHALKQGHDPTDAEHQKELVAAAEDLKSRANMVEVGNVDFDRRPVAKGASLLNSMSFSGDKGEVLIPTVGQDGREMSPEESIAEYNKTGQHLGVFKTPEDAKRYAEQLHSDQAAATPAPAIELGQPTIAGATPAAPAPVAAATPEVASAIQPADPAAQPVDPNAQSAELTPESAAATKTILANDTAALKADAAATDTETQRIHDENTLQQQEGLVRVAEDYKKQTEELNQKYEDRMDGQMAHYRAAVDDLRAINPNPWHDITTGYQVASALFIGLNQIGLSLAGSNAPNVAMTMYKDAMNQDLQKAQQQLDVGKSGVMREGQLLERMREVWGDEKTAIAATKAAMTESVLSQARRDLANKAPDIRGLQAEKTIDLLQVEHNKLQGEIIDKAMEQNYKLKAADQRQLAVETHATIARLTASEHVKGQQDKSLSEVMQKMELTRGAPKPVINASEAIRKIGNAKELIAQYKNLDDMPQAQFGNLVHEIAAISMGSAPTEGSIHGLTPDTFKSRLMRLESEGANKPKGAQLGAFIAEMQRYLEGLESANQGVITKHRAALFRGFHNRLSDSDKQELFDQYPELEKELHPPGKKPTAEIDNGIIGQIQIGG